MITLTELADKVAKIEAKYTDKSDFSISVRYRGGTINYRIDHAKNEDGYKSFDTGFGITNINDLLRTFELGMHNLYRSNNNIDDIIIDQ